jgi:hypothetical protein
MFLVFAVFFSLIKCSSDSLDAVEILVYNFAYICRQVFTSVNE